MDGSALTALSTATTAAYLASSTLAAAPEATTDSGRGEKPPSSPSVGATKIVAIVLPSVFAMILLILIAVAFFLPRFSQVEPPLLSEERRRRRMNRLNKDVKAQAYKEWYLTLKGGSSSSFISQTPVCVICLDVIVDTANVRGLGCLHVFHQECLDDWFSRFNNKCPLCHRPILRMTAKEDEMDAQDRRRNLPPPPLV